MKIEKQMGLLEEEEELDPSIAEALGSLMVPAPGQARWRRIIICLSEKEGLFLGVHNLWICKVLMEGRLVVLKPERFEKKESLSIVRKLELP